LLGLGKEFCPRGDMVEAHTTTGRASGWWRAAIAEGGVGSLSALRTTTRRYRRHSRRRRRHALG
jgi:hypothetical protein